MAAVLARSHALGSVARRRVFEVVNGLSRRNIVPTFQGLVVLTQSGIRKPRETKKVDNDLRIVWAGARDTELVFRISDGGGPEASSGGAANETSDAVPLEKPSQP